MSTTLRPSAAIASVIAISSAVGSGIVAGVLTAKEPTVLVVGAPFVAASAASFTYGAENTPVAGLRNISFDTAGLYMMAGPRANPFGPEAGNVHANLGKLNPEQPRSTAPSLLVAMN